MGFDNRQSTPGFKRQMVITCGEARSYKRASLWLERAVGLSVSPNTIERICLEVGDDLSQVAEQDWNGVLDGETIAPEVAVVATDGGRIRTRVNDGKPGVRLTGKGWNETKNAIFVSAKSEPSDEDPEPNPPACFLDRDHVAKLTETAKTKQNTGRDAPSPDQPQASKAKGKRAKPHKPERVHRTVISSMKKSSDFGEQMKREATRRKFGEAPRRAFVGDGLACNWTIHQEHFSNYVPILDFVHAVSYLFAASIVCFGRGDQAWQEYCRWMTLAWQGKVGEVLAELAGHQDRLGAPPPGCADEDPREQLRKTIGYLRNNAPRMKYDEYRCAGLPTTSAWMESAVKEINYRTKGTEMFWNNPAGAEAILQIRSAALSDDDRLVRFLSRREGMDRLRKEKSPPIVAV